MGAIVGRLKPRTVRATTAIATCRPTINEAGSVKLQAGRRVPRT
jgi:hypothetical protein